MPGAASRRRAWGPRRPTSSSANNNYRYIDIICRYYRYSSYIIYIYTECGGSHNRDQRTIIIDIIDTVAILSISTRSVEAPSIVISEQ